MLRGLWRFRGFILRRAVSELRHRYAGSVLGLSWNVLNPLAQILVYTVVFTRVMAVRVEGIDVPQSFALYLCAGLIPWLGFSQAVIQGSSALVDNASYLKKLPIPEEVFIAQAVTSATLGLVLSMGLLFLVGTVIWQARISWLAVPLVLLLLQLFGLGLSLLFGTLNAFIRDIGAVLAIALPLWMWLAPIVYVPAILPDSLRAMMHVNPAYPFIDALHEMVVYGAWPTVRHWLSMLLIVAITLVLAGGVLHRLRPEVRDVL
jgi:homopolymeric O-antigen transport system permease protein